MKNSNDERADPKKPLSDLNSQRESKIASLVHLIVNIWNGEKKQKSAVNQLIKDHGKFAIPHLIKLLKHEEIIVRKIAVDALTILQDDLSESDSEILKKAGKKQIEDKNLIVSKIPNLISLLTSHEKALTDLNRRMSFSQNMQQMQSEFKKIQKSNDSLRIKEIGKEINKIGGHSAMWIPYNKINKKYKYPPLGSILENSWKGIGTWH